MDNSVVVQIHTDLDHPTVDADTVPRKHGRKKSLANRTNRPDVGQDPKFDAMYQQLAVMQKQLNTMKRSIAESSRAAGKTHSIVLAHPNAPASPSAASVSTDCLV